MEVSDADALLTSQLASHSAGPTSAPPAHASPTAPTPEPAVPKAAQTEQLEPAVAPNAAPPQPDVTTYARYYAERWGQAGLAPDQPLLVAARVSRQQLARGLDLRRSHKRSYALHLEAEGGWAGS